MNIFLKNVSKKFGKVTALNQMSLCFESGKLTGLLGPSGCGKTTILNIISGVLPPSSGDIFFGDNCITNIPLSQRNIGYVFQNYSLYPNMTAYENLKFPLTNQRLPGLSRAQKAEYYDEKIREIAELLQIEETLSRFPSELSGGQQQRIALGRAIIRNPDILLMDEPFANLDRKLSVEMREEVREIQQKTGITTVFVTHNQADANAICDQIVLMNQGTIQQVATASEIYDHPANLFVADFFGEYGSNLMRLDNSCSSIELHRDAAGNSASYVSFRPEDLQITGRDGAFQVKSATRVGGSWIYALQNGKLRFSLISQEQLQPGERVSLQVDGDRLNFYDIAGMRIKQNEVLHAGKN